MNVGDKIYLKFLKTKYFLFKMLSFWIFALISVIAEPVKSFKITNSKYLLENARLSITILCVVFISVFIVNSIEIWLVLKNFRSKNPGKKFAIFPIELILVLTFFLLSNSLVCFLLHALCVLVAALLSSLLQRQPENYQKRSESLEDISFGFVNKNFKIKESENKQISLKKGEVVEIIKRDGNNILIRRYNQNQLWLDSSLVSDDQNETGDSYGVY